MYELKVKGMTCGSCAETLSDSLREIDPEAEVSVNIRSQTVIVKSSREQALITSLIEDAGYPVLATKIV